MHPPLKHRVFSRAGAALALLPLVTGCLVDDPPAYVAPQQTAPRIIGTRATPPLDQIIITQRNDVVNFSVPIVSEDAGEVVMGRLVIDFDENASFEPLNDGIIPPSTLDEGERNLQIAWTVRSGYTPGCHRITLRVSHLGNFVSGPRVIDRSDIDEIYWFSNIDVTPQNANALVDCPRPSLPGTEP